MTTNQKIEHKKECEIWQAKYQGWGASHPPMCTCPKDQPQKWKRELARFLYPSGIKPLTTQVSIDWLEEFISSLLESEKAKAFEEGRMNSVVPEVADDAPVSVSEKLVREDIKRLIDNAEEIKKLKEFVNLIKKQINL